MWGFGGRFYWGRKERGKIEGTVVIFAWMSSQERHLMNYVQLYASLGWNSLVCHSQFLNMFFPDKATSIASDILNELVKELKHRPCPVVLVAFSGGPKACMYNVLQMIEGTSEAKCNPDDCRLVRRHISGYIYDSSPVDFTSDLGTRFILHPAVLKMSRPPSLISWAANITASSMDALFLNRFESQRAEYWQTLYKSASMGAPYLILCSESDDLAPYQTICNFSQRLQELGANVKVVKWNDSPHVGHYLMHPIDYKAAVTELLTNAVLVFAQRNQRLEGDRTGSEGIRDAVTKSACSPRKDAPGSIHGFLGSNFEMSEQFLIEYQGGGHVGPPGDVRKEGTVHLPSPPSINAHGVLGQILFDACVPKNVEDWEIKPSESLIATPSSSPWPTAPFNPIKCIWRSRL